MNFQDIETRAVLQLLAETSGRNIVVSDTVQGNVTLRLRNVPWDQALDIVMTTKGLDMRENGNVIIVAPAEEIAARETADLEARQAILELEPLYSEFLQVNYAKAADLAALIGGGDRQCRRQIAVRTRQRWHRRSYQHIAGAGHGGTSARHSAPRPNTGYSDSPGVDRITHRCRQ